MSQQEYSVKRSDESCNKYKYTGYIDGIYAGHSIGYEKTPVAIDLQYSQLEPEFRGTTAVRAFKEIIDAINKDYKIILCRIRNDLNTSLKIALDVGFHVIGTSYDGTDIYVELLKIKGGD